jgi:predicted transcriptional regulator of viral defense system
MAHFDVLYEIAADNYGLVTFAEAQAVGIKGVELTRFVKNGRLERLGQGIYKLTQYIPTPYDQYAQAVAIVGQEAYVHGESVLAMHNLALVNPLKTTVATTKRTRKKLPNWIRVVAANRQDEVTSYEGIPCQSVADALRFCKDRVMKERLADALRVAVHEGLVDEAIEAPLREELDL